ncbi:MAG: hypothetical protein U0670_02975 [Anaerolineae bacterium]
MIDAAVARPMGYPFAWRRALTAIGWWQPFAGLIAMIVVGLLANAHDPVAQIIGVSAVAGIGAMVGGIQGAYVFAPADDPSLELILSAPRPLRYLVFERLIVLAALNFAAALIGAALFPVLAPGMSTTGDQLVRWFAPFVFMVGLGMVIGLVARRSNYGMLIAVLLDGSMLFGGAQLLVARFEWAWVLHLFLPPEQYSPEQIFVNRALLIGLGMAFIAYSMRLLRDEEPLIASAQSD